MAFFFHCHSSLRTLPAPCVAVRSTFLSHSLSRSPFWLLPSTFPSCTYSAKFVLTTTTVEKPRGVWRPIPMSGCWELTTALTCLHTERRSNFFLIFFSPAVL